MYFLSVVVMDYTYNNIFYTYLQLSCTVGICRLTVRPPPSLKLVSRALNAFNNLIMPRALHYAKLGESCQVCWQHFVSTSYFT